MTNSYEYVEDARAANSLVPEMEPKEMANSLVTETVPKENVIVAPITDAEAERGGLAKIVGFMRTKQSKDALRKKLERKELAAQGKSVLTVTARDEDRKTLRSAASRMIEDESVRPAVTAILTSAEYRSLLLEMSKDPELHQAIMLVWRNPQYVKIARALETSPKILASLRVMLDQPNVVSLGRAASAATGLRGWVIRRLVQGRHSS